MKLAKIYEKTAPFTSCKVGCTSENYKQICIFAQLALPLPRIWFSRHVFFRV